MASTNSLTLELESQVSAPHMFRATVMDWHTLAPKLAPDIFDSAHLLKGDGSIGNIGSIRQYNCASGTHTTHMAYIRVTCYPAHLFTSFRS
jgi:hypothetical protein